MRCIISSILAIYCATSLTFSHLSIRCVPSGFGSVQTRFVEAPAPHATMVCFSSIIRTLYTPAFSRCCVIRRFQISRHVLLTIQIIWKKPHFFCHFRSQCNMVCSIDNLKILITLSLYIQSCCTLDSKE